MLLVGIFTIIVNGTIGRQFSTGNPGPKIKRIKITGQERSANIVERNSLNYLVKRPKLDSLPSGLDFSTNSFSFEAVAYNERSIPGRFGIVIDGEKKFLVLRYYTSMFSDTTDAYCLLDSNAPPELIEALNFLISETNRGKSWQK
jgi:hypothetical protein